MRRTYKYQLRPTTGQSARLTSMLADHCALYNAALQERRDAYRHPSKTRLSYGDQSAQLKAIRTGDPDGQGLWSFSSQQQTLRRLNRAFTAFFARVRKNQTPGYPRFRSLARFDTVDFVHGDGARWDSVPAQAAADWTRVYLQGIGHIKVNQHRPVTGRVKQVSVKREGTRARPRWYVIVSCDDVPEQPLPATGNATGLDLATGANGLAYTATLDQHTGEVTESSIGNLRAYHRAQGKLARAQQAAARTKPKPGKRSSSRHKHNLDRVRTLHAKIARIRLDYLHKQARALVEANDIIALEALQTANMTRAPRPKPDPDNPGQHLPNGAAAKAGLNKSILDSAWGLFISLIDDKAECAGRQVVKVNPANTSRTCHACGHLDPAARDRKHYACTNPDCGWTGDADTNAAHNILRAGLALSSPAAA